MGKKCALKNCKNYQKEPSYGCDISFHGLPKNEEMRKKWLNAIPRGLARKNATRLHLCGVHFTPESFQPASLGLTKNMLRRNAVPSIFDDNISTQKTPKVVANNVVTHAATVAGNTKKLNFVNASGSSVFLITKTDPSVQSNANIAVCTVVPASPQKVSQDTSDAGVQVSLATDKERELQKKLYVLAKRLQQKEERLASLLLDFKTLMDER